MPQQEEIDISQQGSETNPKGAISKLIATFLINGKQREAIVQPHLLLLDLLRDTFRLTGAKRACAEGNCGSCTVLIDGKATCSCITLAISVRGQNIKTIEGLAFQDGSLHPLQHSIRSALGRHVQVGRTFGQLVNGAQQFVGHVFRVIGHKLDLHKSRIS